MSFLEPGSGRGRSEESQWSPGPVWGARWEAGETADQTRWALYDQLGDMALGLGNGSLKKKG